MTTADLRSLVASLPPGGAVTLPREALAALLAAVERPVPPEPPPPTGEWLGVAAAGRLIGRAPSTVRGLLLTGKLRGTKPNGRDWAVSRRALLEYMEAGDPPAEANGHPASADGDLTWQSWRDAYAGP